jgi:DNA-binding LacI/PurR family transcriptional regulator
MEAVLSPSVQKLAGKLGGRIRKGKWKRGELMPSVREIARTERVGYKTAWRAIQALQVQGLIASEPGRGCRVISSVAAPKGAPLAVLSHLDRSPEQLGAYYAASVSALERAASPRGLPVVVVTAENRSPSEMIEQALAAQSSGLLVDAWEQELIDGAVATKLPVVMLDVWTPELGLDSVMKDGQHGGILAVRHLVSRGRKRIAWIGPGVQEVHAADRYAGYVVGMSWCGLTPDPKLQLSTSQAHYRREIEELLSRPDRPDAVVALWHEYGLEVKRAADRLGLKLGEDLDLVGWCVEEMYDLIWRPGFEGETPAPTISWSMRKVAEAAVTRLVERQAHPNVSPVRIKVPVELRLEV